MAKQQNCSATHVSVVTIVVNIVLSVLKAIAGIVANSAAMVSDAVHSVSDVMSTIIVIIGINISNKSSDKEHPYGHERMECTASIILAVALFITGIAIGISAIGSIIQKSYMLSEKTGIIAVIAAIASILTKEWMYWYTRVVAKKLNSTALMADAWHHRSDAISSVGALIGIVLSRMGYPVFDPIVSIIICALIVKVAIDIFSESIDRMVDKAADEQTEAQILNTVKNVDGVTDVNKIKTRLFGSKIYVDIEISAKSEISLKEAHDIAHEVHDTLEDKFPAIKHCMVHVNPDNQ